MFYRFLLEKIESRHYQKNINYYGIDIIPEMINIAKKRKFKRPENFTFECEDVLNIDFKPASIITSYYTLQFILPSVRQELVNKIYNSLNWGGAFFVFEKTRGFDARFQDFNTHVYNEYKIKKGYKPEEIFEKSRSLAGVWNHFLIEEIRKCLRELDLKILSIYLQIYVSKVGFV